MTPAKCCLTIVFPTALEEDVVDLLLAHPHWVTGFTVTHTEGAGRSVRFRGTGEHVRGRSRRMQVQVVLDEGDARGLLAVLRSEFPGREIAYWLTPVIEFARLWEQ